jgi:hypothetical protein
MPSGMSPAADRLQSHRRPGAPGGARTEAQKAGLPAAARPVPLAEREVTPEIVDAFLARDENALRDLLGLEPWQDGPWVAAPCDSRGHGEGWGACRCGALALRARILAKITEEEASGPGA